MSARRGFGISRSFWYPLRPPATLMTSTTSNAEATRVEQDIRKLAATYARELESRTVARVAEMDSDDVSHGLIYRILGISEEEGRHIDIYQNKGRLLYKSMGAFLEQAAKLCFAARFPGAASLRILNTRGKSPKTFEIDCLVEQDAVEIKWRDATTDGDHITKEHTRVEVIAEAGYRPVRVMFYSPQRDQAIKVQKRLEVLYKAKGGQYFQGRDAWQYVHDRTALDLYGMLERIAQESSK